MTRQKLGITWYNKDMALLQSEEGRYDYQWVDPSDMRVLEVRPLVFDDAVVGKQDPKSDEFAYSERADLEPQEDNLLILGESGEVLKSLTCVPELAEKYLGKIKLVYIDPPFNTSQTFTHYEDNLEHSIWLSLMRDRLVLLKKLLSNDGSIWVHLDDVENHRMRMLLDEVFGSNNFIAEVIWQKASHVRNDALNFSSDHDTIIVYGRPGFQRNKLPASKEMLERFKSPDGDPNPWQSMASGAPGAKSHQGMVFAIQHPKTGELIYPPVGNCWRYGQPRMLELISEWAPYKLVDIGDSQRRAELCGITKTEVRQGVKAMLLDGDFEEIERSFDSRFAQGNWPVMYFTGADGSGGMRFKSYAPENYAQVPRTLWHDTGRNDEAKRGIQKLFERVIPFDTPKPEELLERIIHIATNPGDIVLDCFAGSGTTAAVAQKMGRRWVTCELVESTFRTFTKPRLEKVIKGQDLEGITITKGERIPASTAALPKNVSAEDAARFNSVLNKLIADSSEAKRNPLIKRLKQDSKTIRSKSVINWRGGGGFRTAHLAPAIFAYDEELRVPMLTEIATGKTLRESVRVNLRFYCSNPDERPAFDGRRGNTLLKVNEGTLDRQGIDAYLGHLQDNESLIIATTALIDGTREYLRKARTGSRIIHIPDGLFNVEQERK